MNIRECKALFRSANEVFFSGELPAAELHTHTYSNRKYGLRISAKHSTGCYSRGEDAETGEVVHFISICTNTLRQEDTAVLETLLHEMVHLYCSVNGINDTSGDRYHTAEFAHAARQHGLISEEGTETRDALDAERREDFKKCGVILEESKPRTQPLEWAKHTH